MRQLKHKTARLNRRCLVVIIFALLTVYTARAQAPSSIAGMTLRTSYQTLSGIFPIENNQSLDFASDGTFSLTLSLTGELVGPPLAYGVPINGTYSYVQTSPSTATLNLNPPIFPSGANVMVFSSGAQGSVTNSGATGTDMRLLTAPFSLTPTFGTPSNRALINMSVLIVAGKGNPISFGFVLSGSTPYREVLIRAIGPSLSEFGINSYAMNPIYNLSPSYYPEPGEVGGTTLAMGWSATPGSAATISAIDSRAGAFSLLPGSNDKADVFLLSPGAYTITVNPTDSTQVGTELIEVYEVE